MKNKVVYKYDGNMTTLTFPRTLREACPNDKYPWLDDGGDKLSLWDWFITISVVVLWWAYLFIWSKP